MGGVRATSQSSASHGVPLKQARPEAANQKYLCEPATKESESIMTAKSQNVKDILGVDFEAGAEIVPTYESSKLAERVFQHEGTAQEDSTCGAEASSDPNTPLHQTYRLR